MNKIVIEFVFTIFFIIIAARINSFINSPVFDNVKISTEIKIIYNNQIRSLSEVCAIRENMKELGVTDNILFPNDNIVFPTELMVVGIDIVLLGCIFILTVVFFEM